MIEFFRTDTIPLELHGQETDYYCACASGQMILKHHHFYYEQDDIATAMGTTTSGTSNPNQVTGYESLSHNYLDAEYDTSPTWAKARDEIDQGRPMKSGVPGHARACSGYSWVFFRAIFAAILGITYFGSLYIYDPWPQNANNTFCNPQGGAEYWEDWDAITHTNFIFLRPCSGNMTCQD